MNKRFSLRYLVDNAVQPLFADLEGCAERHGWHLVRGATDVEEKDTHTTLKYHMYRKHWFDKQRALLLIIKLELANKEGEYLGKYRIAPDEGVVIELCEELFNDAFVKQAFTNWFYRSRLDIAHVKHTLRKVA
jgi:hypothetical protein